MLICVIPSFVKLVPDHKGLMFVLVDNADVWEWGVPFYKLKEDIIYSKT